MKAKRGKRSEPFWPSIVMKKWLNIKPEVYDFSEDEVDTETESEDDGCSVKDARVHDHARRIQGNKSVCATQRTETASEGYISRHKRGKSETLRLQYINTKDIRVTIGTWNVAGKLPDDDLEIEEWLCTKEPADIYIIGFQEVVPLNAGNVLGAETRKPIPKWERIIRKTLNTPNKSLEQETKHKSYSAPPSPVLRTSSAADILADEIEDPTIDLLGDVAVSKASVIDCEKNKLNTSLSTMNSLRLRRIYGIDSDSRLDWPEIPLDKPPQVVSSSFKLRRVMSSSARVGFGLRENSLPLSHLNVDSNDVGLKRSYNSFSNFKMVMKEKEEIPDDTLDSVSDKCDGFSEEEVENEDDYFLEELDLEQEIEVLKDGVKTRRKYVRIVSKQMVGIYVSIWVRRRLRRHINHLKVSPVGIGIMGYMGNKGSVSISMSLYQTRLCFVCSHLSSGQKEGDQLRRNSDVQEILRRTRFSSFVDFDQPQTIPAHDQVFWFGDLNYRLNGADTDVRKLVALEKWDELLNNDQLKKELCTGRVFQGWKEGPISFPPTYKYEINSDRYFGENPKEGEKKRSPAWCDRILWFGKGIKQSCYQRGDLRLSDHRPVSSNFVVEVEVFDHRKLQKALHASTATVHPEIFLQEDEELDW